MLPHLARVPKQTEVSPYSYLLNFFGRQTSSQIFLRSQCLFYGRHYTFFSSVPLFSWLFWKLLPNSWFSSKALFLLVVHIYKWVAKLVTLTAGRLSSAPIWQVVNMCSNTHHHRYPFQYQYRKEEKKNPCHQSGFHSTVARCNISHGQYHSLQNKPTKNTAP